MTDAEILTLVTRLESCQLPKTDFHHRDHLSVAVVYLMTGDFETAVARMRETLKRFAAHHAVPGLYHETLTRFWLMRVERLVDKNGCLGDEVGKIHSQLTDKTLPSKYYSRDLLDSQYAREMWAEPDLAEIS